MIIQLSVMDNESEITTSEIMNDIKFMIMDYLTSQGLKIKETKIANDVIIVTEDKR